MANQPTKAALLGAVSEFLEQELKPVLSDAALAYKLRIAMNVLAIVIRETEREQESQQQQLTGLQRLLSSDSSSPPDMIAELCQRIRSGQFDGTEQALLAHLEETTLNQLAIDNPRYSTYRQLTATES